MKRSLTHKALWGTMVNRATSHPCPITDSVLSEDTFTLVLSGPETDKKVSMGLQCAGNGSAWDIPGLTCLSIVTCSIPTGHTGYIWWLSSPGKMCLTFPVSLATVLNLSDHRAIVPVALALFPPSTSNLMRKLHSYLSC